MSLEYWEEAIIDSLERRQAWDVLEFLTDSLAKALAEDIEIAHENYGMAHGHDAIPNPLETEMKNTVSNMERSHTKDIEILENEIKILKQQAEYWRNQYINAITST